MMMLFWGRLVPPGECFDMQKYTFYFIELRNLNIYNAIVTILLIMEFIYKSK